jgi:pyruvate,water dikinase
MDKTGKIEVSDDVAVAIHAAIQALPGEGLFAVRSSAVDEDGAEYSFAGQLESFLFVLADQVVEKVSQVWQSGFTERVLAYRRERGMTEAPAAPAVLVQRMIDAEVSGVAFAADPVKGSRSIVVISAVFGLGTALVGGDAEADTYRLHRSGQLIDQQIATKSIRHVADPNSPTGVRQEPLSPVDSQRPTLDAKQMRDILELVLAASRFEKRPQDIEWAIAKGKLYLLQSRPISSLASLADPDAPRSIWDNSNIAESYNGVTTPLTFSFAQLAYDGAYRQFCHLMKVPSAVIADSDAMFGQMLGLIRGRVYYNLLNWYRLLAMMPGFSVNRHFMEQMMGVREGLPEEIAGSIASRSWAQQWSDRLRLGWSVLGLVWNHWRLPKKIEAFYARLNQAMAKPVPPLEEMRLDQLVADFRLLESRLLTRWDAPLINDFLAMIFFGALGKVCSKWGGDNGGNLQNDLIADEGGIISTEPVKRIAEMAAVAARDPALVAALCSEQFTPPTSRTEREDQTWMYRMHRINRGPAQEGIPQQSLSCSSCPSMFDIFGVHLESSEEDDKSHKSNEPESAALQRIATLRELDRLYQAYLEKFGDRCLEELKLESATLVDDPTSLLRSIGHTARRNAGGEKPQPFRPRQDAERKVADALHGHPIRRWLFAWILRNARGRVRDRENLRFERTRLFGRVRRIFVEIGRRFVAEGVLADERDIFYLTLDEILGFVEGTGCDRRLDAIAERRAAEFKGYREDPAPAERFETRGAVQIGNNFTAAAKPGGPVDATGRLQGIGCCPGIVRGPVRLIRDPRGAQLKHGEILVAERTDPGWILLFPAAAGVLVERGSLLSHSAIVARELGIPAIVSIPNLMNTLIDGQQIEMDGATGSVSILA